MQFSLLGSSPPPSPKYFTPNYDDGAAKPWQPFDEDVLDSVKNVAIEQDVKIQPYIGFELKGRSADITTAIAALDRIYVHSIPSSGPFGQAILKMDLTA